MSTNINNSSLLRTRSLKLPTNTLKPAALVSSSGASVQAGPSNVALFLTNLRLLDLDLRDDWPEITAVTFSNKDQKKRIQSVEWALYQLFALWDPEETRQVFWPFFQEQRILLTSAETTAILPTIRTASIPQFAKRPLPMSRTSKEEWSLGSRYSASQDDVGRVQGRQGRGSLGRVLECCIEAYATE